MTISTHVLSARGVTASLDLEIGQLAAFSVTFGGRDIAPFHRVPWAETPMPDLDMPPHLRRMSIDFFCAPFGLNDVDPAPYHGWPGNSRWVLIDDTRLADGRSATFQLEKTVMGATVTKTLTVRDDHPFLYQTHRLRHGTGMIPLGHHAMVQFPANGLVSFSDKLRAQTSDTPLEGDPARGRSVLRYPATGPLDAFPRADGATVDLHSYPIAREHDDLVVLVDKPDINLGWVAAVRPDQRDMALVLKSPRVLPTTILWYSHGGRFYPPWSNRHTGVLGIEEVCSSFADGHRASIGPNALSEQGTRTCVSLDEGVEIRCILGALGVEGTPSRVMSVRADTERLSLVSAGGRISVPYDPSFLRDVP